MHQHERHATRILQLARVLILATLSLLFTAPPCVVAQDADDVVRVRTDLVVVPVVVTDGRGRRVADLQVSDFLLTDNGQSAKVEYFASGTDRVAMLFALDTSGSSKDTIAQQRQAATELFSRFGRSSRIAVLQFSEIVKLKVPFTRDTEAVETGFDFEAIPNAGTAIFDGAAAAVRSFDSSGAFSSERRIVILISDGLDTLSSTKYKAVVELARL